MLGHASAKSHASVKSKNPYFRILRMGSDVFFDADSKEPHTHRLARRRLGLKSHSRSSPVTGGLVLGACLQVTKAARESFRTSGIPSIPGAQRIAQTEVADVLCSPAGQRLFSRLSLVIFTSQLQRLAISYPPRRVDN